MKAITANRNLIFRIGHLATGKVLTQGAQVKEVPIPTISETEILVKVSVVALNPIDHKYIDLLSPNHSRIGCDYAGTVTKVGSLAPGNWKVGDRVAGMVNGGLFPTEGSYAEYLSINGELAWKIPAEVSDEDASTYGISATTAMLALNGHLGVPWIDEPNTGKKDTILIYSAASAVGLFAIQIAKAAGWTVIATASSRSTELVKRYGADAVFDYTSPSSAAEIAKAYPNISKAFDCYSVGNSTEYCAQVLKASGGKVITLLDSKAKVPGVEVKMIIIFTVFGVAFQWLPPVGPKLPVIKEDRESLVRFYGNLPGVLGKLKAPPVEVLDGSGFDAIFKGLDTYRSGTVAGKKLVVRM